MSAYEPEMAFEMIIVIDIDTLTPNPDILSFLNKLNGSKCEGKNCLNNHNFYN
jgi:hypothetical protein